MKVSDYVASFLKEQGIDHVFGVTGSSIMHTIHSISDHMNYIPCQHEQGAAIAADAYARVRGLGCAVATSGPGFTNLITGIACSYLDSVPTIFITGNVPTKWLKEGTGLRQYGGQELDPTRIVRDITKYCTTVRNPDSIPGVMHEALRIATTGRKGAVLVDIPDDIQRADIDPNVDYSGSWEEPTYTIPIDRVIDMIRSSSRPLLVPGWGIHCAGAEDDFLGLIDQLNIPVAPTWSAKCMIPTNHRLYAGTWGPYGTHGNMAIQNCDLLIAIGARLDPRIVAGKYEQFAPNARKIVVDRDLGELSKFDGLMDIDLPVFCDAGLFIRELIGSGVTAGDIDDWMVSIDKWAGTCYDRLFPPVNPYVFISHLSDQLRDGDIVCTDTGATLAWTMQAFSVKPDQRILHAFNTTPMGYGLPASIGAMYANEASRGSSNIIAICADGGIQMNIQELATIAKNNLPIKIFVLCNDGYGMIRQTEDEWMESRHRGTTIDSGLPKVSFIDVARAYGFNIFSVIDSHDDMQPIIDIMLYSRRPSICEVRISPESIIVPKVISGNLLPNCMEK